MSMPESDTKECDIMSIYRTLRDCHAVIDEFAFKVAVKLEEGRRIFYTRGARAFHHSLHYYIERKGE